MLLSALLLLGLAPTLGALVRHVALRRATPAVAARVPAPAELRLEFTEAVELTTTTVGLTTRDGRPVSTGPLAHPSSGPEADHVIVVPVVERLLPGEHAVAWQLTGRDGHPVRGRYAFTVLAVADSAPPSAAGAGGPPRNHDGTAGAESRNQRGAAGITGAQPSGGGAATAFGGPQAQDRFDAESWPYVALRWASYVVLLLAIGAVLMARVAERAATIGARYPIRSRLAAIGLTASWLGIALVFARLLAQSWAIHGAERAMSPMLLGPLVGSSTWGRAWTLHLVAGLVAAAGFTLAYHDTRRRTGWRIAEVAALLAAAGAGLSGHAAAVEGWRMPLLVAATGLHVLSAGVWIGGVMMLALAVLSRADAPAAANVVRAYSAWALGAAGLLVVTGLLAAWTHLDDPLAPWESRYGTVLLLKLALVALVAALGALNWRRLGPSSSTAPGRTTLLRAVRLESLVALLVLLVTAVLVAVPPLD